MRQRNGGSWSRHKPRGSNKAPFELKFYLFTHSFFLLSMQNCSRHLSQIVWCEWRHQAETEPSELRICSLLHWGSPSPAVYLRAKPIIWPRSKRWVHSAVPLSTFPCSWDVPSFGALQQRDGRHIPAHSTRASTLSFHKGAAPLQHCEPSSWVQRLEGETLTQVYSRFQNN